MIPRATEARRCLRRASSAGERPAGVRRLSCALRGLLGAGVLLVQAGAVRAASDAAPAPGDATVASGQRRAESENSEVIRRFLEDRIRRDPEDITALNRLAALYLQRLRDTGRLENLDQAARAARQSLAAVPGKTNQWGLAAQARVEFESHHFAEARDVARQLTRVAPDRADGFLLLGDALLELGDLPGAEAAWKEMPPPLDPKCGGDLELEVRLARLDWLRGAPDDARARYSHALALARAAGPPRPEVVVWCLVQRGQLAFGRGDWDGAEQDYTEAQNLAADNYAVREHLAELRAAQGRFPQAEALYRQVIEQTGGRPEFMQALGDVAVFANLPAEARESHDKALRGYLESVHSGQTYFLHHLAGFYCDVQPDPAAALQWARRDFEARQSVLAYDVLAWALYQNAEWDAARDAAQKALALGTRDAHLLYHAAMIFSRGGDLARGDALLRQVREANPHYLTSFHAHR